jgi:hypothetical protein
MFKRTLQVEVVKKKKSQDTETPNSEDEIESAMVSVPFTIDNAIKKIGLIVCAYVILDTVRQVVVITATPK